VRDLASSKEIHVHLNSLAFVLLLTVAAPVRLALCQTSFPEIKDPKDITVTLQRAAGLSGSPSYKLVVSGDGTVRYEGYGAVHARGVRTSQISRDAVNQLIEEFRKAHFFELHDYRSTATDLPGCRVSLQVGSISKEVLDYGLKSPQSDLPEGFTSGAPEALVQLENRIDEIANSRKWVKGSVLRRILHLR